MSDEAAASPARCPFCLEVVNVNARRCRHCGSDLREQPQQDAERTTFIVDRGLIRFGKFSLALLAIFVVFGTYVFGFDIRNLVVEMRALRTQITEEKEKLAQGRRELEDAQRELAALRDEMKATRKELADAQREIAASRANVADIEKRTQGIAETSARHLVRIERHLSQAGVLIAEIEQVRARTLTKAEEAEAEARRRELAGSAGGGAAREAKLWPIGHVLRVRFLGGTRQERDRVATVASEWEQHANIKLAFSEAEGDAEIRVGFVRGDGSWSYVGTDALVVGQGERTMNLGWDIMTESGRDTILSEFGHALGLVNEHQNPTDPIIWNTDAVYAHFTGAPNHWPRETVYHNILRRLSDEDYPGERPLDPDSLMMVPFPAGLTDDPRFSGGINPSPGLSESDRAYVRRLYPATGQ